MNISMVLDRSGSMSDCVDSTIDAVNKYLLEARADTKMADASFDLTIFDSQSIDTIRSGKVPTIADISNEDYIPRGGTPLFDAIGRGIDALDAKGDSDNVLVIVTDGLENASRKHTHGSITELLKARQDAGWLVVFLGAGLEASRQGANLGIAAGKVANIGKSASSLRSASANTYAMTQSYAAAPDKMAFAETAAFTAEARAEMNDENSPKAVISKTMRPPLFTPKPAPAKEDAFSGDVWGK